MELPVDLYDWLLGASVLTEYDVKEKDSEGVVLEQEATQLFEIGLKMPFLLHRLQALKSLKDPEANIPLPGFDGLKDSMTPAAKLYNWNVIVKALDVYGVHIEDDVKSLIVAGDLQLLVEVLEQIKEKEEEFSSPMMAPQNDMKGRSSQHQPTGLRGKPGKTQDKGRKGAVDIANLNINKRPEHIENCLEFLLITISRAFELKPKQAAGLLTDSNKYLSHILVKGLKGDFDPVTAWLMEVYSWSKTFSSLIKCEEDNNSVHMVLNAFKGGLYSKYKEVAVWTAKIFSKLAYDFVSLGLLRQAWEWYISVDGGLDGTVYFLQKHSGMEEIGLELMVNMGKGNLFELFTNYHKNLVKDPVQYWRMVLSFVQPLATSISKWGESEEEELDRIIQFWLDCACRQSDNDGRHTVDERAVSLSILSELWLSFPQFVEMKEEIANHVLTMLKRSTRDKNPSLQLFSLSHLFKLLETFAVTKNSYAPVIYKALTFSLVENHQSLPIREFIMQNFRKLFTDQPNIPVGILIEPLVRQIQLSENSTYFYNVADFEFFDTIAENPKLTIKNAIQLLDILAKIMLSEPLFAESAKVPFLKVVHRWINESNIQDFLTKFAKVALSTLFGKVKKKHPQKHKPPKKPQRYPNHQAMLQAQAQERQDELMGDMECKFIVEALQDIQALGEDNVNDQLKDLILAIHFKIKQVLRNDYPPLKELLNLYGDPDEMIAAYEAENLKDLLPIQYPQGQVLAIEAPPPKKPESQQLRGRSLKRDKPGQSENKAANRSSVVAESRDILQEGNGINTPPGEKALVPKMYQLVPYYANKAEREISQKAMKEIERIRKQKLEREAQKQSLEVAKREKMEREKRALKQQLERRKIELGVGKNANAPILFEEGLVEKDKKKMKKILPEIQLIDFACEEEREKDAVFFFMRKYKRLFRYLFTKYSNSCYSRKVVEFDALREKAEVITIAEVTKMLKDHNVDSYMLSRDELATILRLVNMKANRNDITTLAFEGFQDFFLQTAIFIYSKPPVVLSHLPLVESIKALVKHFENATSGRGENVVLYKDPDTTALGDQDLLKELNKMVKTNPDYPVPEGYRKVTEKEAHFDFELKPELEKYISEGEKIAIELLNEIVSTGIPGVHFIESIVKYELKTKVYPDIVKPQKQLLPTRYMDAVEKKVKPKDLGVNRTNDLLAPIKKRTLDEPMKRLPTSMKLIVAGLPKEIREIGKEVAVLLDEIIEAVEDGRSDLSKKKEKINKALKEREEYNEELKKAEMEKEQKRKSRQQMLKHKIEEVRKKEAEEVEKKKKEEEENKRKNKERLEKEKADRQKEREEIRKKIQEVKGKKEEEKKKAQEEETKKQKEEAEKRIKAREEFLKKKKEEMEKLFKEKEDKRKKEKEEEERKAKLLKEKKEKEKRKMDEQLKGDREVREAARKQKLEFEKLMKTQEVSDLLTSKYAPQLDQLFNFYAKLEDPDLDQESLSTTYTIQSKSFVKFAQHFKVVPDIVELENIPFIFNNVLKNRPAYGKENVKALIYEDFLEALVKICIMGKYKLGAPLETEVMEEKKDELPFKAFDVKGIDAEIIEKFLKILGLTPGEKKGPITQKLKKIRQENSKIIKGEKVEPKPEVGKEEAKLDSKEDQAVEDHKEVEVA